MNHYEPLSVTSEIGRLREVIVHTPGREIEMVTPRNFGRMLFDDTLYLKEAAKDHSYLVRILKRANVRVRLVRDLLSETLHLVGEEGRTAFARLVCRLEGCQGEYSEKLRAYSPEGLADVLIGGEPREESVTRFLRQDLYAFPPIPNMMFVRDCATVTGNSIILSSMAHAVRSREILILDLIFGNHPHFRSNGVPPWRWLGDFESRLQRGEMIRGPLGFEHISLEATNLRTLGIEPESKSNGKNVMLEADYVRLTQGPHYTLEGGNLFLLAPDTLLVGCSKRGSAPAIDALSRELLGRRSAIRNILVAVLADCKEKHLDTYFSIIDRDHYLLYPAVMEEFGACLTMLRLWLDKGQIRVQAHDTLEQALRAVGLTYDRRNVGYCAGIQPPHTPERDRWGGSESEGITVDDRILQEREWNSEALNMLPLAPGKLIASARNRATLRFLESRCDYECVPAEDFCKADDVQVQNWLAPGKRIVIALDDSELTWAHGGPRSLVLPVKRDDLDVETEEPAVLVRHLEALANEDDGRQEGPSGVDLESIKLRIESETGRLRSVVLHTPGKEIARLTPTNHDALLYDGVLDETNTRKEHKVFSDLLTALGVIVYEIEDLVATALKTLTPDQAERLFDQVVELQKEAVEDKEREDKWLPSYGDTLRGRLKECWDQDMQNQTNDLAQLLVTGMPADSSHPALFLHDADPFLLTPIPNILFMRDPGAVVGENAVVCYMRKPARRREGLLLHHVCQALAGPNGIGFDFFAEKEKTSDPEDPVLEMRGKLQQVEGGDILVIHKRILAIGCSERTTREMIEELATQLFRKDLGLKRIYAVFMPAQRSSMHLDTIFTMLSEDECLVHQPMIMPEGVEQVQVIRITANRDEDGRLTGIKSCAVNSLVGELEKEIREYEQDPNYRLKPIFAGGQNPLFQDREQYTDGTNFLAIAPGVVIGYERNYRTFQELEAAGYRVCHASEVLEREDLRADILNAMEASISRAHAGQYERKKYAIKLTERELSRARGGPRCMTMPLEREPVPWAGLEKVVKSDSSEM